MSFFNKWGSNFLLIYISRKKCDGMTGCCKDCDFNLYKVRFPAQLKWLTHETVFMLSMQKKKIDKLSEMKAIRNNVKSNWNLERNIA